MSLNNLAHLLQATGDYDDARRLYERALVINEQALGPDHPDIATNLSNLASLLESTGDYVGAQSLYRRALAIYEQALVPDHIAFAVVVQGHLANLDATLKDQNPSMEDQDSAAE